MTTANIDDLSTCHLIFELLHDGEGNIYPNLEPISPAVIVDVLRRRHGSDLGSNAEAWAKWFLEASHIGTEDERDSIATSLRIWKIEKDAERRGGI